MQGVVIYGVGSRIVVDIEASLERAGLPVIAAVKNVPGEVHVTEARKVIDVSELRPDHKIHPFIAPMFVPANRQKAAREAFDHGFQEALSLIDPSVPWPRVIDYRHGLYVNAGCTIGAASAFDAFVFINRGANLGHHVELGAFVSVGPGAVLSGSVRAGKGVVIGAGAVILPGVRIGDNAVVAAGSVVTRDVPEHCLVVGNPARIARESIPGFEGAAVL